MHHWLRFMAQIARAQHDAATTLPTLPIVPLSAITQAVDARTPPLAVHTFRREPIWRNELLLLLEQVQAGSVPREAQAIAERLRGYNADAIERLADALLN